MKVIDVHSQGVGKPLDTLIRTERDAGVLYGYLLQLGLTSHYQVEWNEATGKVYISKKFVYLGTTIPDGCDEGIREATQYYTSVSSVITKLIRYNRRKLSTLNKVRGSIDKIHISLKSLTQLVCDEQ